MKLCGFNVGLDHRFFLIAGPCVIESEQLQMDTAGTLKEITSALGIPFIFKSSYDKANRSSGSTFRGPGMEKGLEILAKVKRELHLPILTDVHTEADIAAVAAVVDVLQTPAFLCRQTDFIRAVAQSGKPVNIKKGQFLAPHDMKNVIDKARAAARDAGLPELVSAAPVLVTTTWCPTCAAWPSCVKRALPWCLTPLTPFSYRAVKAPALAACVKWCPCCQGPLWLWAWRACSWKHTPTQPWPCLTAPMPCHFIT
ncbi:MAG: 2-dehydro-3-deoxyphosphooctonate aldolase [Pseudomonadota bacterium]